MVLTRKFIVNIITVITLLTIIHIPLGAEIIILKNGKVFEGEIVKEDDNKIELKTEFGVLSIPKSDVTVKTSESSGAPQAIQTIIIILPWLFILSYLVLVPIALVSLRKRPLDELSRVLWIFLILLFPIVGAIAFFIISPGKQTKQVS